MIANGFHIGHNAFHVYFVPVVEYIRSKIYSFIKLTFKSLILIFLLYKISSTQNE